ncbi:MAG: ATP-dependent helicase [Dehalococcoidia bacterium]|nr:ATP-dependent helicase [Dehalococcoidia bacterium]
MDSQLAFESGDRVASSFQTPFSEAFPHLGFDKPKLPPPVVAPPLAWDSGTPAPTGAAPPLVWGDPVAAPQEPRKEVEAPIQISVALGAQASEWDSLTVPVVPVAVKNVPKRSLTLDAHQEAVVNWRHGTALVAAAAGSGKSLTLLERTAALIQEGVLPEQIITLVYNRAAGESLRAKLIVRLGSTTAARCNAVTFHAYCYGLLKEWFPSDPKLQTGRLLGMPNSPSAAPLAFSALREVGIEAGDWKPYVAASEQIREALIDDIDVGAAVDQIAEMAISGGSQVTAKRLFSFMMEYQKIKRERRVMDFADMLYSVGFAIRRGLDGTDVDDVKRAEALAKRFLHVQVDELQDVNPARIYIAEHLGSKAQSLMGVCDLRQSIFGFTGSQPQLVRDLLDRGATLLALPVNRRSTKAIVEAGNAICAGRDWNLGGACLPKPDAEEGEPVQVVWNEDPFTECMWIADELTARLESVKLTDSTGAANYAVICRTNAKCAEVEAILQSKKIPARTMGLSGGIWTSFPGREILAYLRAAAGEVHEDLILVANKPRRFMKKDEATKILEVASRTGKPLLSVLRETPGKAVAELCSDLFDLSRELSWDRRVQQVLTLLNRNLEESKASKMESTLTATVNPDDDKGAFYSTLAEIAIKAGSIAEIEKMIEAAQKVKKNDPAVEIITAHSSKGLQWHTVIIRGAHSEGFPHKKATDTEEERRLFYVAVTRAKKVCLVSIGGAEPSPFLASLKGRDVSRPIVPMGAYADEDFGSGGVSDVAPRIEKAENLETRSSGPVRARRGNKKEI